MSDDCVAGTGLLLSCHGEDVVYLKISPRIERFRSPRTRCSGIVASCVKICFTRIPFLL